MTSFDAGPVMAGLTGFQRRSVEHVTDRFHGDDPGRRFLVADETGLGKSLVARGVIARTIETLQHERGRKQINVVYVCANTDLATQNVARLDVTGGEHRAIPSRLSMLAKYTRELQPDLELEGVAINLVSFTPGTSFSSGHRTGQAQERALLFLLLSEVVDLTGWSRHAALVLLRGTVGSSEKFDQRISDLKTELKGPPDPAIGDRFLGSCRANGLVGTFESLLAKLGRRQSVPSDLAEEIRELVGAMLRALARAGLDVLNPDLVILDEFQRFPELLDESTPPGELAGQLFDHPGARVLLLSATPYKPFTYAEESGDDHHADFLRTLQFLDPVVAATVSEDLAAYRRAATQGDDVTDLAASLRTTLLRVMSRSERPAGVAGRMLTEHVDVVDDLSADDLLDYVALQRLSALVKGDVSLEYWKSTPYFANFCDEYTLAKQLRLRLKGPDGALLRPALEALTMLDREAAARGGEVDLANGKLRSLARQTVDAGWWQLLWMPPSLPYLEPTGPYAEPWARQMTKRLVFSTWTATPTAIASLLSQRAGRAVLQGSPRREDVEPGRRATRRLLNYAVSDGKATSMTTLALFWPMPGLAALADPLTAAGRAGAAVSARSVEAELTRTLRAGADKYDVVPVAEAARAAFGYPGSLPAELLDGTKRTRASVVDALDLSEVGDAEASTGRRAHVDEAFRLIEEGLTVDTAAVAPTLAALAAHSPANIAWRALRRATADHGDISDDILWASASIVADAFRSLFNRPETIQLLEQLDDRGAYWQKVLRYCAAGNLQAVLDEYLHHVVNETRAALDDSTLVDLAESLVGVISLSPATYRVFDPQDPDTAIPLTSRFALRYGGARTEEDVRQPEVRAAFNSPFWPFVLASTSVGQEGMDFHWWCSAVVHWNTPANPVDFEQREGRVDRYGGHAVRRNLAHRHGASMLGSDDPWRAAYELGKDERATLGEFAPHWVYPGPATIERHLSPYPLSVDVARLERLKSDLGLYRLTFGQPRQEDMLALLRKRGLEAQPELMAQMRIDLSPPQSNGAKS